MFNRAHLPGLLNLPAEFSPAAKRLAIEAGDTRILTDSLAFRMCSRYRLSRDAEVLRRKQSWTSTGWLRCISG